jgi:hypothetical protein
VNSILTANIFIFGSKVNMHFPPFIFPTPPEQICIGGNIRSKGTNFFMKISNTNQPISGVGGLNEEFSIRQHIKFDVKVVKYIEEDLSRAGL